ncbi:MAG TPA: multicopper oxidase domain-containing protein [Ilumatobacter sp.]|nr:multicopper oxidase domain-containing protein [Ilumatobacter sp.]
MADDGVRGGRRWRRFVAVGGAATGVIAVLLAVAVAVVYARADTSTVGSLGFRNALRIPPLDEGTVGSDGTRRFDLTVQAGETVFLDDRPTATWGVNGAYLGPTLRARTGERVEVAVHNRIGEATSMHWHGMHLPAVMDGGPHQPIEPGDTWVPTWVVDQPAATLWYHPHPHGRTAQHVYRGVAGMFQIVDDASDGTSLPATYGVDDIPLIVQDRKFDGDHQFDMNAGFLESTGVLGDKILVNGTFDPHVTVRHEQVRFRLLNASNARFFEFGFADGRSFRLVATDGGFVDAPAELTRVQLSPGERAEIVVEFEAGDEAVLRTFPHSAANFMFDRFTGGDDEFDVLAVRAAAILSPSEPVPHQLPSSDTPPELSDVTVERRFTLGGNDINGKQMDMGRIDAVVEAGSVELWEVRNQSGLPHNFHVHDVQFHVADVNGELPATHLRGRKDTVEVGNGATVRLLIRFGELADPNVAYMFHCHVLQHEDAGMMGQFVVVEPGGQPGELDHAGHTH